MTGFQRSTFSRRRRALTALMSLPLLAACGSAEVSGPGSIDLATDAAARQQEGGSSTPDDGAASTPPDDADGSSAASDASAEATTENGQGADASNVATDAGPLPDGSSQSQDASADASTAFDSAVPPPDASSPDASAPVDAGADAWIDASALDASWPIGDGACAFPATAWTAPIPDITGPPETAPTAMLQTVVPLVASAIAYDPTGGILFATTPASDGANGNSLVAIDPWTGVQSAPTFIGSSPDEVAATFGGNYAYVSLAGSQQIQRYDVTQQKLDILFAMGPPQTYSALDLESLLPLAASGHSVIAEVVTSSGSLNATVFDDGTPRATQLMAYEVGSPFILGGPFLRSGDDGLWFAPEGEFGSMQYLCVNDAGVFLANEIPFPGGFETPSTFGGSELTAPQGDVFDARTMVHLGSYGVSAYGDPLLALDEGLGHVTFLVGISDSAGGIGSEALLTFDHATRALVSRVDYTPVTDEWPASFVRFGEYGFAVLYFSNSAGEIDLIRSPLLKKHP
jgi:hypothetical protein